MIYWNYLEDPVHLAKPFLRESNRISPIVCLENLVNMLTLSLFQVIRQYLTFSVPCDFLAQQQADHKCLISLIDTVG